MGEVDREDISPSETKGEIPGIATATSTATNTTSWSPSPTRRSAGEESRRRFTISFQSSAVTILLALFATGADAGPYTPSLPPHTNIRTVAVISAIGDTLMVEHVRDRPFEWLGAPRTSFLEISDWGLDDLVTREATAALSKRFSVKPVTYEEADFDTWTWDSLSQTIRALPLPVDDIDAYVVILRDWQSDSIGHSVHKLGGVGLYRRDDNRKSRLGVFAAYRVAVIDARSGDIVASRTAQANADGLPWAPFDMTLWPESQDDLTGSQQAVLNTTLRHLLTTTLPLTLQRLLYTHP